jgi:hypothetical protein
VTLTVTAAVSASYPPRVAVTVSSSPAVTASLTITRTHADGSVHPVLTDSEPVIITSWAGYDYHAPFNEAVTYTAATSDQSATSSAVYMVSDSGWLMHPSDPTKSMPVLLLTADETVKFASPAKTYAVLNRRLPVARTSSPRGGAQGNLKIKVASEDVTAAMDLFADGGPLLLNGAWGPNDYGWKWVLPGELSVVNPAGFVSYETRWFQAGYVEVADPDVNIVSPWNYDAVAATYASYDAVAAAFADYNALALGP